MESGPIGGMRNFLTEVRSNSRIHFAGKGYLDSHLSLEGWKVSGYLALFMSITHPWIVALAGDAYLLYFIGGKSDPTS